MTLSVADVSGAAATSSPSLTGTVRVTNSGSSNSIYADSWIRTAKNFNSEANVTSLTPDDTFVPNFRWLKIGAVLSINGKRGNIEKLAVSDVDGAAPKVNASFSGTTNFSGTVVFDANGDARGRTWPATDNSVSFATTAWVRNAMSDIASKAGFAVTRSSLNTTSGGSSGWIDLPSWLGGLRIQWAAGEVPSAAQSSSYGVAVAWPVAFREGYAFVLVTPRPGGGTHYSAGPRTGLNNRTHVYVNAGGIGSNNRMFTVFAIGR